MTTPEVGDAPDAAPPALPNGWRGRIAALDKLTGDNRYLATPPGGVRTRAYPLSLTMNHVGDPTGYPVIGSVDRAWDGGDGYLYGEGKLDTGGPAGAEFARQLAGGYINRVSIDPDQVEAEHRMMDSDGNDYTEQFEAYQNALSEHVSNGGSPEDFEYGDQWPPTDADGNPVQINPVVAFTNWRLAGLAAVPVPAYSEAAINPEWDYVPSQALPSDAIVSAGSANAPSIENPTSPQDENALAETTQIAVPVDGDDPMQLPAVPHSIVVKPARPKSFAVKGAPKDAHKHLNIPIATFQPPLGTGNTSPTDAVDPSYQTPNVTLPNNGATDDVSMPSTPGVVAAAGNVDRSASAASLAGPNDAGLDLHGDAQFAAASAAHALKGNKKVKVVGYGHLGDSQNPHTVLLLQGPGINAAYSAAQGALAGHNLPEQPYQAHMSLGQNVPPAEARKFVGRTFSVGEVHYQHSHGTTAYAAPRDFANASTVAEDRSHAVSAKSAQGGKSGSKPRVNEDSYTTPTHSPNTVPRPAAHIVAAAGVGGQVFHREFFEDPKLTGPTPLTVTEDGRVYGHVRLNGTCYQYGGGQGNGGRCVEPPMSKCGYAKFMVHGAKMDDGSIMPVGAITFGEGHVSRGGLEASRIHYDNVASVAALAVVGDDEWGLWISGEVRDEYRDRAYDLLLSPLSGHWEPDADNRNHLELLAAHIVVTPGYSVRRIVAAFDEEENVTSVILTEDFTHIAVAEEDEEMPTTRADVLKALADIERGKALAAKLGIDLDARLAAKRDAIVAAGGSMPIASTDTAWDGGAAGGRVLDWATTDGKIDAGKAGQGFLAHVGDGSKRGDWKLPFADVHGGGLSIIPRGVSAAAGRLNQTQGIDQAAAKSKIDSLYSRIHAKYPDWPASPDA